MAQRIFDKDNEKDMQDLWDILPEKTAKITGGNNLPLHLLDRSGNLIDTLPMGLFKINWCGVEEITRPVDYESMIGCVCKFSTCPIRVGGCFIGILDKTGNVTQSFHMLGGGWFEYCEPAKKSELKFWGE